MYYIAAHFVQNVFKTGAVLVFISEASGKTLRVMQDGDAQGKGGEGKLGMKMYLPTLHP